MKSNEQIFYDWLFAPEEDRKRINPFSEMIKEGANTWPIVPEVKFQ